MSGYFEEYFTCITALKHRYSKMQNVPVPGTPLVRVLYAPMMHPIYFFYGWYSYGAALVLKGVRICVFLGNEAQFVFFFIKLNISRARQQ